MGRVIRLLAVTMLCLAPVAVLQVPVGAITGGTEDTANTYSNVGMVVFYQPDGRFRCSATLIAPQVVLTAAHCTFQDVGKVIVTFDPVISRDAEKAEFDIPRASDDSDPDDAHSDVGYTGTDVTAPKYSGDQQWFLGSARTHPAYSGFTDVRNWNDSGVILLDSAPGLPVSPIAPAGFLDTYREPLLNRTSFLTIGYGTEVRKAESGPQLPTPMRRPIVRRYTTEIGQKLTPQILYTNGNEHDPRAGGGSCVGDSGGPIVLGGYVVGNTSFGYTSNCRYISGYQRVDAPVVRNWLLDCTADLVCPTK